MNLKTYYEILPKTEDLDLLIKKDTNKTVCIDMVRVSDEWFPNFSGNFVCMKLIKFVDKVIVILYGKNTFEMEKTYTSVKIAKVDYFKLVKLRAVNQGILLSMGFTGNLKTDE